MQAMPVGLCVRALRSRRRESSSSGRSDVAVSLGPGEGDLPIEQARRIPEVSPELSEKPPILNPRFELCCHLAKTRGLGSA